MPARKDILIALASLILSVLPLFPGRASGAQYYTVAAGDTRTVSEWSECRNVIRSGGYPTIFIPTNSASEWSEFRLHYPAGISLANCGPSVPSYAYRRKITITSSAALTNYPVKFTIDTSSLVAAGKMQSDCDDVRVTSASGTAIDFLVELCNTASTEIWAEVPSIANGTTEIYMFYGNPSATAGGNGDNTFALYDNFNDGNLNGWAPVCYWAGGNEYCASYPSNNVTISAISQSPPYSMQIYAKSVCNNPNKYGIIVWTSRSINPPSGTYILEFKQRGSGGQFSWCSGGIAAQNDVLLDGAAIYNNPTCNYAACNTCTQEWRVAVSNAFTFSGGARTFRFRTIATDCEVSTGWVDDIKVRRYFSPEPTTSVGPEELV